jgi:hypothetical protein
MVSIVSRFMAIQFPLRGRNSDTPKEAQYQMVTGSILGNDHFL